MLKKAFLIITLLIMFVLPVFSQNQSQIISEEYQDDEFPQIIKDLRRFEIIFFGSLPVSFFLALEGYDVYRFCYNNFNEAYKPWPLHDTNWVPYSSEDSFRSVLIALSISFIFASADYILGKL
ncbi:MAG: hypothetical protein JXR70_12860 [Spirochaetales bacterium]|nr:hypothetical protein [Spirochaetales bacterium]